MKKKKVIKVSASWCGPCKALSPIFEDISKDEKFSEIEFDKKDADTDEDFCEKNNITSLPTILFFDENEKEKYRMVGLYPKKDIIAKIEKL